MINLVERIIDHGYEGVNTTVICAYENVLDADDHARLANKWVKDHNDVKVTSPYDREWDGIWDGCIEYVSYPVPLHSTFQEEPDDYYQFARYHY